MCSEVTAEFERLHEQACDEQKLSYIDPVTGYSVMTSYALQKTGKCCGNGCRHCPFSPGDQMLAKRPSVPCFPYQGSGKL